MARKRKGGRRGRPAAPLPQDYLAKKGGQWRPVRWFDREVLQRHVLAAASHPEIGHLDTVRTLEETVKFLKWKFIAPSLLESALCACNFLAEVGAFQGPQDAPTFATFKERFERPGEVFDLDYNYFRKVKNV